MLLPPSSCFVSLFLSENGSPGSILKRQNLPSVSLSYSVLDRILNRTGLRSALELTNDHDIKLTNTVPISDSCTWDFYNLVALQEDPLTKAC